MSADGGVRVLVTGSRDWPEDKAEVIVAALHHHVVAQPFAVTLVHGGCPTGADAIADRVARGLGWKIEVHPANWKAFGKAAGPRRNKQMVEAGADICIGFIKDHSQGATLTVHLADEALIPTAVYSYNSRKKESDQ